MRALEMYSTEPRPRIASSFGQRDVLLVAGTLGTLATGLGTFAQRRRKARP
jgi:hypothetical protein